MGIQLSNWRATSATCLQSSYCWRRVLILPSSRQNGSSLRSMMPLAMEGLT